MKRIVAVLLTVIITATMFVIPSSAAGISSAKTFNANAVLNWSAPSTKSAVCYLKMNFTEKGKAKFSIGSQKTTSKSKYEILDSKGNKKYSGKLSALAGKEISVSDGTYYLKLSLLKGQYVKKLKYTFEEIKKSLTGLFEYKDGKDYYNAYFKSNGICIFQENTLGYTRFLSGLYEWENDEYKIRFKSDYNSIYSTTANGSILEVRQVYRDGSTKTIGDFREISEPQLPFFNSNEWKFIRNHTNSPVPDEAPDIFFGDYVRELDEEYSDISNEEYWNTRLIKTIPYVKRTAVVSANSTAASIKNETDAFLTQLDTVNKGMKKGSVTATLTLTVTNSVWACTNDTPESFNDATAGWTTAADSITATSYKKGSANHLEALAQDFCDLFPEIKDGAIKVYLKGGKAFGVLYVNGRNTMPKIKGFNWNNSSRWIDNALWLSGTEGIAVTGEIIGTAPVVGYSSNSDITIS